MSQTFSDEDRKQFAFVMLETNNYVADLLDWLNENDRYMDFLNAYDSDLWQTTMSNLYASATLFLNESTEVYDTLYWDILMDHNSDNEFDEDCED